ncbi:uncharacterized protein LOC122963374 [Acropora millepora]|uniref:uncharacterized protein LOC122963374 n=1 Tax=Acropora millepora TaxID=45264 RepID=UPI001CF2A4E4|nr:uncharacterized protein LOC122963374 [Acropora millepora]
MAVRISNTIRAELDVPIDNVIFWTNSLTVLQCINNRTRRFHRFLVTRLEEIHEHTTPDQWNHVPGVLNPADDGSRGLPIQAFQPRCRWWSGPEFLRDSQEHWPHRDVGDVAEDDKEAVTLKVSQSALAVATGSPLDELMRRFSSWPHLVQSITWLCSFCEVQAQCITHSQLWQDRLSRDSRCFQGHSKDSPAAVFPRGFGGLRVW